jgi:signal transduction histidine kinase/CheY-like chemotaxis protein
MTRIKRGDTYVALAYQYDLRNMKKMEAAVADAEQLTRAVTDANPIGYILYAAKDYSAVACNEAAVRLFRCPGKQYLLDNYWEFYSPERQDNGRLSNEMAHEFLDKALNEGQFTYEWTHKTLAGDLIPMENTLTPLMHKDEKYVASFKYDMRKTKQLLEQLKEAVQIANDASKAKGEFLSNMSHEMRTPLNAIIGMTTIGKNTDNTERKNYALGKIEDASNHLMGVINDVLDMSKIEANKLELSPVEFNFERLLPRVITVVNYRLEEKRQKLSVTVDGKMPRFIVSDDQRLAQVITNLLSNAIKFTPEGGEIQVKAALAGEENGICELRVEVADNGIGISPAQQKRLFQAFMQAESGTSREFGGTGLGLVISKRIVELMKGKILVESELGKGSRFIFTVKAPRGEKNFRSLLEPGINWENMRVLAVDDTEETRVYFSDIFQRLNVTCDVAADGNAALRMVEAKGDYDIYFVDWRMPGMDGIELTRRLKARGSDKSSVIVMISAYGWAEVKGTADSAGVDKYLFKPLFSSAIIDCVNECLGVSRADQDEGPEEDRRGKFTGKKMLLAEDIEINREILLSLLEGTGITIDCAENGRQALEMVQAAPGKYDIVFMDVQMPQMDGLEATRRIRALPVQRDRRLPIVAMTANVFKDDIKKCLAAGMDDHLGKPLDMDMVFKKMRKYLA